MSCKGNIANYNNINDNDDNALDLQCAGRAIAGDCTGKPDGLSPDPTSCSCFFSW
jgi:hypothetical protein